MKVFWTDGSANPNPGPGGFAVIDAETKEPAALGVEDPSTNIRMEGSALIAAMELAEGEECEIHTDSEFWVNVLTKWAPGWERNEWRKSRGEIKNLEMVKRAYELYREGNVRLEWVRGHQGTELNELADEWAGRARLGEKIGE